MSEEYGAFTFPHPGPTNQLFHSLWTFPFPAFLFVHLYLCPALFWYISLAPLCDRFLIPLLELTVYQNPLFICSSLFVFSFGYVSSPSRTSKCAPPFVWSYYPSLSSSLSLSLFSL